MATITGTPGSDNLNDQPGDDQIIGDSGNDTITVSQGGVDGVDGGEDRDRLIIGASTLSGPVNMNAPIPDPGTSLSGSASYGGGSLFFQGIEDITIISSSGSFFDNVTTGGGDDSFTHFGINSLFYLRDDVDLGGGSNDVIIGDFSAVNDFAVTTQAEPGFDFGFFVGGNGKARIVNAERMNFTGGAQGDTITGLVGNDLFFLQRGGNDSIAGGSGDDGFYFGSSFDFNDIANGGAGNDQLALRGTYNSLLLSSAIIQEIETLALLSGSDARFEAAGGPASYNISTTDAAISAARFTVNANGLAANEGLTFNGAAESTSQLIFFGGLGTENLTGGAASDGFFFGANRFGATDIVNGLSGADDQLALRGNFALTFGAAQISNIDTLALISGSDPLYGVIAATSYTLTFNDGNVAAGQQMTVTGAGLASNEQLIANAAAETNGSFRFIGGAASDALTGGAGDDVIFGGNGNDSLVGNGGNDRFVYTALSQSNISSADDISGFEAGDRIDLTGFDADVNTPGVQTFTWVGSNFSGAAGEIGVVFEFGSYRIYGDVNGGGIGAGDLFINFSNLGNYVPTSDNFIGIIVP
jgi:Ca2+-binding RTX toxin-like protein